MMRSVLQMLGPWGPVLFGIGFLAPLIATLIETAQLTAPFDLSPIQFGLIAGTLLGLVAKIRGRWL